MSDRVKFAYGQARLYAHHGRRPSESVWRRMEASKSLGHYLETARQTTLKDWVVRFTAASGVHEIERSLRHDWRAYVDDVASWQPAPWRQSVHWVSRLVDLPFTAHHSRGYPPPVWLAAEGRTVPPKEEWTDVPDPVAAWVDRWRGLWPSASRTDRGALEKLVALFQRASMAAGVEQPPATAEVVGPLTQGLERLFRDQSQRPAAAFAYLSLAALDYQRLRSGLVRHCLFAEGREVSEA